MQRVQTRQDGVSSVSINAVTYSVDKDGIFVVQDSQIQHVKAHPHMYKIIGPEQVKSQAPKLPLAKVR